MFTSSASKIQEAKRLGADEVVVTKNPEEFKKFANSLDFIINTIAASHDLDQYIALLKRDGTMCLVGAPPHHIQVPISQFNFSPQTNRRLIDRRPSETQEMLNFCAKHHILADIEMIPIQKSMKPMNAC